MDGVYKDNRTPSAARTVTELRPPPPVESTVPGVKDEALRSLLAEIVAEALVPLQINLQNIELRVNALGNEVNNLADKVGERQQPKHVPQRSLFRNHLPG